MSDCSARPHSIIASLPHDGGYLLISLGLLGKKCRINLDWLLGKMIAIPDPGTSLKILLLNLWREFRGKYYFISI
ncbi:hypothetical protein ABF87_06350 [Nitrosomonas sp. JL21]|nr:hypothetical protein [Nitrosomonas sp. JL21]